MSRPQGAFYYERKWNHVQAFDTIPAQPHFSFSLGHIRPNRVWLSSRFRANKRKFACEDFGGCVIKKTD